MSWTPDADPTEEAAVRDATPDAAPAPTSEESAKPARRRFDIALFKRAADGGGGNDVPGVRLNFVDDLDRKAEPSAGRNEEIGRAAALAAEMKVPADDDRADAKPRHQHALDELLRRLAGERRVKIQRHHP